MSSLAGIEPPFAQPSPPCLVEGNYKCGFDVFVGAELVTDFGQVFTFLVH